MDVGHRGAAGVDDLVAEDECKLGKLSSESIIQVTDSLDGDGNNDECNVSEAADPSGPKPALTKCLVKSATYPCSDDKASNLDTSNDEDPETACKESPQRSKSMPPISAMKGSREKLGKAVTQLSVTWAPDVYDPVPNSLCHTVKSSSSSKKKSRRDREKDKKNGKKGQKGSNNSSRGTSSKEKKQTRRKPDKSYKAHDIRQDIYADPPSNLGYDAASPDFCGSSFLKNTVTEFHYPVAEAL